MSVQQVILRLAMPVRNAVYVEAAASGMTGAVAVGLPVRQASQKPVNVDDAELIRARARQTAHGLSGAVAKGKVGARLETCEQMSCVVTVGRSRRNATIIAPGSIQAHVTKVRAALVTPVHALIHATIPGGRHVLAPILGLSALKPALPLP